MYFCTHQVNKHARAHTHTHTHTHTNCLSVRLVSKQSLQRSCNRKVSCFSLRAVSQSRVSAVTPTHKHTLTDKYTRPLLCHHPSLSHSLSHSLSQHKITDCHKAADSIQHFLLATFYRKKACWKAQFLNRGCVLFFVD